MTVNATDIFERYMYDESYDDVIESNLPTLEVTEVSGAGFISKSRIFHTLFQMILYSPLCRADLALCHTDNFRQVPQ